MPYTYGDTGLIKRRYNTYIRLTAAYTSPGTLAEIATLLGTGTQIGKLEDKSLKINIKSNEAVELNDGTKKITEYIGTVEARDLNHLPANIDTIIDEFDNRYCDFIFDDPVNKILKVVKNCILEVEEEDISGDKSSLILRTEKKVPAKEEFRETTDYSTFS